MNDRSHPDLEALSDHDAGLLDTQEDARVEQHVQQCAQCRDVLDSVVQVRGALRAVGSTPEAMPEEVSDRLTAALRAEAVGVTEVTDVTGMSDAAETTGGAEPDDTDRRDAADPDADAGHAGGTGEGRRRGVRSGPRWGRAVAVAAGVAILAVGGTAAYQSVVPDDPGNEPVATDDKNRSDDQSGETYALGDDGAVRLTEKRFDEQVRSAVERQSGPKGGEDKGPSTLGDPKSDKQPKSDDQRKSDDGPTTSMKDDGTSGLAKPDRCVPKALKSEGIKAEVLDARPARFDGEDARLAIAPGSSQDELRAYVITGCPGDPTVAHQSEVSVR